jgi:alkyldihydroxyacetonephosphate synthase
MRRWNGWGEEGIFYPISDKAKEFLKRSLGPGIRPKDVSLSEVISQVPPSRLPSHPLVSTNPEQRVRHALGQSLPDWIAARSGNIPAFPDGVAFPSTNEEVQELIKYAKSVGARLIPYGGGTSVAGQLRVLPGGEPVLSVDLQRINQLIRFDEKSHLATFGAGIKGPDLEATLRVRGFTLGHYPQSFEYSTLGGWVATRSVGLQSIWYGRIDELFAGGRLESPVGTLLLPPFPASAAGPDLRQIVLGSEGRLGILTEVTVRVRPLPKVESFVAVFFPSFEDGLKSAKEMVQSGIPLSMIRLSSPEETTVILTLAEHERMIRILESWLSLRGAGENKCLLIIGASGSNDRVRHSLREALSIAKENHGIYVGHKFAREWIRNRFRSPYLRNTLWELGYAIDTLETAGTWTQIPQLIQSIENALRHGLDDIGEKVYVFTHLSHIYRHGSNVYTTFLFRLTYDPEENLQRWKILKDAASRAILACGGTISHQHGVGIDHLPYLEFEKGTLGIKLLQAMCKTLDPEGIMNPGKLIR